MFSCLGLLNWYKLFGVAALLLCAVVVGFCFNSNYLYKTFGFFEERGVIEDFIDCFWVLQGFLFVWTLNLADN